MIGRHDIHLPVAGRGDAILDACVRTILAHWRDAVFEDVRFDQPFYSYESLRFSGATELLAYKDRNALDSWTRLGADKSNANTMLHLLARKDTLTIVVDDQKDPEISGLLQSMEEILWENEYRRCARREAA